jgi:hypothetical protein
MVTNINRDSNRNWKQPDKPDGINPSLHITAFSKCEVDRSTLALYYSRWVRHTVACVGVGVGVGVWVCVWFKGFEEQGG